MYNTFMWIHSFSYYGIIQDSIFVLHNYVFPEEHFQGHWEAVSYKHVQS